jgi:hypothetical protein
MLKFWTPEKRLSNASSNFFWHGTMRDRFFTCVRYENLSNMVVYNFP